jgi:hypothetical protein
VGHESLQGQRALPLRQWPGGDACTALGKEGRRQQAIRHVAVRCEGHVDPALLHAPDQAGALDVRTLIADTTMDEVMIRAGRPELDDRIAEAQNDTGDVEKKLRNSRKLMKADLARIMDWIGEADDVEKSADAKHGPATASSVARAICLLWAATPARRMRRRPRRSSSTGIRSSLSTG